MGKRKRWALEKSGRIGMHTVELRSVSSELPQPPESRIYMDRSRDLWSSERYKVSYLEGA